MKVRKFNILTPTDIRPKPTKDEQDVAAVLADYFQCDVVFVKRSAATTPDIRIGNIYWEIKSPRGNGKYTISDNLRRAKQQSVNIVINLARTKMTLNQAESRTRDFLKNSPVGIKRLLIISKTLKIIDIK